MVKITLPDKSVKEFGESVTALAVAEAISPNLARDALAARVDGEIRDITAAIDCDAAVEIITLKSDPKVALEVMRHSCAHVMAEAICKLFPEAQLVYGPSVENGFYYDIDLDRPIAPDDFAAIELEMQKIVAANVSFLRYTMTRQEAMAKLKQEGNRYKIDNAERAKGNSLSFYVTGGEGEGSFEDLCLGPHVPSTGRVGAFKIMSVAGAYFHGDPTEKMLQRIYGTCFPDQKQLRIHLEILKEAKKRDHRVLGKKLDLFSFHEEGPGFAFLHPNGMVLWNELLKYWHEIHDAAGYKEIRTPIILNEELWHKSGHWDNYRENMYFVDIDQTGYAVKPMNCPGGCLVYNSRPHSYRELPLRMAELGLVHRHEASGVMHGLLRVRQFTQDDAHIYCTAEQIQDEVVAIIELVFKAYRNFGLDDVALELSTMPAKHIGSDEIWETATNALQGALASKDIKYAINPGDGAFYGPKIDFHVRDCLGRSWQLGTIQLDFAMPERFDLTYNDRDNSDKRPVMLHRVVFGAMERFLGILIEHYGGVFPLWLAPEQVRVMPISEKFNEYGKKVLESLQKANLRCTIDQADDKINAKIKRAHELKLPYMLIVGAQEQVSSSVTVRVRGLKDQANLPAGDFVARAQRIIAERSGQLTLAQ